MRILVACELPDAALQALHSLASSVVYRPAVTPAQLAGEIAPVGVLIVRDLRISADLLAGAPALQMIVRAGPGAGDIALEAASAQGVFVVHCPQERAAAVAEHAFALILALDRRIVDNANALREGRWVRSALRTARGLAGRTLGILGGGRVAELVARRAAAFDMQVVQWVAGGGAAALNDLTCCNWPRELARKSDIIVVVSQGEAELQTIVDAEFLQNVNPGSMLIHVGAPTLVDERALAEAVRTRDLHVGIDVYASAPAAEHTRFSHPLAALPNVLATQNVATLTTQADEATADEVVHLVRRFVVSGEVENCLNILERSPATWQLVLRVRDQVGVMASILEAIRADGINAEEINTRIFTGARAVWCTVALDERPSSEALEAIRALPGVLHLELRAVV